MIIKKKEKRPHTKKVQTIALSIFLAVIVWLLVIYINDPDITTTVSDLNVRFVGETQLREKELAVTGKGNLPPLSVTVTGKRSDLMNFMDNIYVEVNVGEISDVGEYNLSGTISIPTARISVVKENYRDIPVKVERLTSKDITVIVKQSGTVKNKLVQSVVTEPRVTITGAKSEIEKVAGAVVTVDISNLREDNIERLPYLLTDVTGGLINSNETIETARSLVEVTNTLYDEKTLPVVLRLSSELDEDYIIKNDKSTITPASIVVGVTPDNTGDKVIVRINKVTDGGTGVYIPENVHGMYIPPESREIKVKADIVKKSSAVLVFDVRVNNIPEGLSARVDGNLTAQVWGEEGKLTTEILYASVDASGLGKGQYSLPVTLNGNNSGFMQDYNVNVIIE